ncbi:MAG: hypothetical protein JWN44_305 [Myxococcales bacterium]|nr:hypothetical protein [Myxococcales bacterium]
MTRALLLVAVAVTAGCSGTTGSGLVAFTARAGGVEGAAAFDTGAGYHVVLSRAQFHLGAVYLNQSVPSAGGPEEPCILPGIYVGEVFGGLDLDLLSSATVPFPAAGEGTATKAVEAEVWLTRGDVNAADDLTPVAQLEGVATRGTNTFPFRATVTIGANRAIPPATPAMPGSNPICRQRIVSLIPVSLTLEDGGVLEMRVDATAMFHGVDFATLSPDANGIYVIPDANGGVGGALFKGITTSAPYQFTFTPRS